MKEENTQTSRHNVPENRFSTYYIFIAEKQTNKQKDVSVRCSKTFGKNKRIQRIANSLQRERGGMCSQTEHAQLIRYTD